MAGGGERSSLTEGVLGIYRQRPIAAPVQEALARKPGYRGHPIDRSAAGHLEPCLDLLAQGLAGENHYHSVANPPYHRRIPGSIAGLHARAGVAARLGAVNAVLAPYGLEVWLHDAWRPLAVQRYFHDTWMPGFLRSLDPGLEGEALWREVERYWARVAPDGGPDPGSPPPHATGGAVDLTLRWRTGAHLFMGTIFDDVTARAHTDAFEGVGPAASFSDREARDNRRLLYWLMADQGFCNNPTEWWHYSWGDQMWARLMGAPAALYGAAPPPAD